MFGDTFQPGHHSVCCHFVNRRVHVNTVGPVRRYTVYKRQISLIKPVAQVAHFLVRINALKDGIVEHCDEWINRFSDLLLETTTDLIDGLYRYAQTNSRR